MNRLQISELLGQFEKLKAELNHISPLNYKTVAQNVKAEVQKIEATLNRWKREL